MLNIKVCGLTDPENVREVAEAAPDFLGFIFHPGSIRYVPKNTGKILFSQISPSIKKTGVFVDEKIEIVKEIITRFELEAVQLHGSESADYCNKLKEDGLITIKAFGISTGFDFRILNPYMNGCNYFLFDTKSEFNGGSGKKFGWSILEKYNLNKPFFLSGGISYEDIQEIRNLKHEEFFAVDLNSRFELSQGIKDAALIRSFINEIRKNEI